MPKTPRPNQKFIDLMNNYKTKKEDIDRAFNLDSKGDLATFIDNATRKLRGDNKYFAATTNIEWATTTNSIDNSMSSYYNPIVRENNDKAQASIDKLKVKAENRQMDTLAYSAALYNKIKETIASRPWYDKLLHLGRTIREWNAQNELKEYIDSYFDKSEDFFDKFTDIGNSKPSDYKYIKGIDEDGEVINCTDKEVSLVDKHVLETKQEAEEKIAQQQKDEYDKEMAEVQRESNASYDKMIGDRQAEFRNRLNNDFNDINVNQTFVSKKVEAPTTDKSLDDSSFDRSIEDF